MRTVAISGNLREDLGKKGSKDLRKEGLIPCVVYGGEAQIHLSASCKELEKMINTPETFIIDLSVEGKVYSAIVQETQYHPVTDELLHVDFLAVTADKPVVTRVPVKAVGTSAGVLAGGKLQLKMRQVKVKALIVNLPDSVEVDITNINLGESVQVKQIDLPNVELLDSPNAVLASVKLTRGAIQAAKDAAALAAGEVVAEA